jgi:hypothetical protein
MGRHAEKRFGRRSAGASITVTVTVTDTRIPRIYGWRVYFKYQYAMRASRSARAVLPHDFVVVFAKNTQ